MRPVEEHGNCCSRLLPANCPQCLAVMGCWDHSPRVCWNTGTTGMPEASLRLLLDPGKCICEFSRNRLFISPYMLVHYHIHF